MPLTKLQKWGNSQGIRIPKETLAQIGISAAEPVEFDIETHGSSITLVPKLERTPFQQLFEGYDESEPKIEFSWDDEPVCKEIW